MIDSNTDLYCVFGKPVRHSKSPAIHNVCFQHHDINAVYLAFEIDDISKGVRAIKELNIKGASITLPFKESIIDFLDLIDQDAAEIGAVNTVINKDGKLSGINTDSRAAIACLKGFGIKDKKVCITGAGGAAKAIVHGIYKEKGSLVIINRDRKKGEKLAEKYSADFIPLDDLYKIDTVNADIIINTTSIGMYPEIDDLSFPLTLLNPGMVVMDIVYNPLKTKLLVQAEKKNCTTIDGLTMFVNQGAAQFKAWTGISPDTELIRQTIIDGNR